MVDAIRRHGLVERTLISSCFAPSLRAVRTLEPSLATAFAYPFDRYRASERRIVPEALRPGDPGRNEASPPGPGSADAGPS